MVRWIAVLWITGVVGAVLAAEPARTGDDDIDFLLGKSRGPAAATRPAIPSSRPVQVRPKGNPEARQGTIFLSNGQKIRAPLSTTREKPLRVWDEKDQKYKDVGFDLIKSMQAKILWERDEKEWHFKESGSDIKEYSGKTYPARELEYEVTLLNDQKITGGIVSPIYAVVEDQTLTFVLNKRQKGDVGRTLTELIYVKRLELEE